MLLTCVLITSAAKLAEQGYLLTFGIVPTAAEFGFGYIEADQVRTLGSAELLVRRFVEKPSRERAEVSPTPATSSA